MASLSRGVAVFHLALLLLAAAAPASSVPPSPTNVQAFHRSGQTFVTWDEVADSTAKYRIYRSNAAITSVSGLTQLGEVDRNTTLDSRAAVEGAGAKPYRIVPGVDLSLASGLFVHSAAETGAFHYAVTSVNIGGENTVVVSGVNSTANALAETLDLPQPVLQRTLTPGNGREYDIYVHWTSHVGTPLYPKMCILPSKAFTFMILRRGSVGLHPLVVLFHGYSSYYYGSPGNPIIGTGYPDEWVLSCDDYLDNYLQSSFWYGYNDGFNWTTGLPTPTTGTNVDYTQRRVVYAIDWARANLPIDLNRVYCAGWSAGGTGATFTSHSLRDRVAAHVSWVPKLDFTFLTEVIPNASFNPAQWQRVYSERKWGTMASFLPCSDGIPTYDRLNYSYLVDATASEDLPHSTFFAGRNDNIVGWAEKIGPLMALQAAKQSFVFLWDSRTHDGVAIPGEWAPMQYWNTWFYDYDLSGSLPAFSNCSADGNLGNGDPTTADSMGTINGYLRWDAPPIDLASSWSVIVRNRDLLSVYGTESAPEAITVDVTPRRFQVFTVLGSGLYPWEVRDATTDSLISSGETVPDGNGLLTVPGVLVTDNGARVTIFEVGTAVSGPGAVARAALRLFPNPSRGLPNALFSLPRDASVVIDVIDAAGRRRGGSRLLSIGRGSHVVTPEDAGFGAIAGLGPGVYFYRVGGPDVELFGAARSGRWMLVR